jgi:hypothetical protein
MTSAMSDPDRTGKMLTAFADDEILTNPLSHVLSQSAALLAATDGDLKT